MRLRILAGALVMASAFGSLSRAAPTTPAIWVNVPLVEQTRDGCGSAAISMVMKYWESKEGQPATAAANAEKIQAALFSRAARGIYASRMQQYFRESGYRAFAFQGQWNDLRHHLQLGRPLIVALKASGPHGPLHYIVVVGIDSERGYVFVNDPARQKMLRISREGFESEWSYTRNWTLLAVPRAGH